MSCNCNGCTRINHCGGCSFKSVRLFDVVNGFGFDYVTFFHISDSLYAGTNIPGGNIDGTWTEDNSPYYINGDVAIADGSQLTIKEGVYIEFQGNYNLIVEGNLIVSGIESELVTFSAIDTNTGWGGIRFYYSKDSSVKKNAINIFDEILQDDNYKFEATKVINRLDRT